MKRFTSGFNGTTRRALKSTHTIEKRNELGKKKTGSKEKKVNITETNPSKETDKI